MKRIFTYGLALLLAAIPASQMRAAGAGSTASAAASGGVKELDEAFLKAIQAGDIEGVMRLYAADAVLFPPGEKAARGQEEIRYKWTSVLNANKVTDGGLSDASYVTSAGVSAGWGNVAMRLEPKSGKPPVNIQGRFSTVAEKRGGKWVYVFVGIGELDEILTLKHYSKTK
jgi:ketosteroid isomerase-like protein